MRYLALLALTIASVLLMLITISSVTLFLSTTTPSRWLSCFQSNSSLYCYYHDYQYPRAIYQFVAMGSELSVGQVEQYDNGLNLVSFSFDSSGMYSLIPQLIYEDQTHQVEWPQQQVKPVLEQKEPLHIKVEEFSKKSNTCRCAFHFSSGKWIPVSKVEQGVVKYQNKFWRFLPDCEITSFATFGSDIDLFLIGDSHLRVWYHYLNRNLTRFRGVAHFQMIHGLYSEDERPVDSFRTWKRDGTMMIQALKTVVPKLKQTLENGRIPILVLNSGAWDLRDLTLEEYIKDFTQVLGDINAIRSDLNVRVIWRNNVPIPHSESKYSTFDYRRNSKILKSNSNIRVFLSLKDIQEWDSWSILFPLWKQTCDGTHYLCYNETSFWGEPGKSDVELFTNYLLASSN